MKSEISAREWFSTGGRVTYDPVAKKMVKGAQKAVADREVSARRLPTSSRTGMF